MSQYAKVTSIPVLSQFKASLATFAEIAAVSLEEAGGDIQRTLLWLREDRYPYWRTQLRMRSERFSQAKLALKRREIFDRTLSGTPKVISRSPRAVVSDAATS